MVLFCELRDVYRSINYMEQKVINNHGITINEAMIICMLRDQKLSSGAIAENLALPPSHTSKLIKSLETKNLLIRTIHPSDKRKMFFALSVEGKELLTKVASISEELFTLLKEKINNINV